MICKINSIVLVGIDGYIIEIEVDIQQGLPNFNMVGLPDIVVKESKERVRAAIKNSGYEFPIDKITINFAPADIKKEGTHLDLAIAVGILMSSHIINDIDLRDSIFIGELSLNGEIRSVKGILPMVLEARNKSFKKVFIPIDNIKEVGYIKDIEILGVSSLEQILDYLCNGVAIEKCVLNPNKANIKYEFDFSEVKGQRFAKRAIEVAAAGKHNLMMIGSPGAGKTMLAQRIPTILPELNYEESIEVTKIYSISGILNDNSSMITIPPFRSPHSTSSLVSLIGGGSTPLPGEVSLAHKGVLFLDELPQFRRDALEALRQPMEDGMVCISRAKGKYKYPASFMLISSMNPCPCGYFGSQKKECRCSPQQIRNYLNKISGPLLDRIDIHIQVEPIEFNEINSNASEESSDVIRSRIIKAREIQLKRFKNENFIYNTHMKGTHIKKYCNFSSTALKLLENAFKNMSLSTRAYMKILKISRTIADLDSSNEITEKHVAEAIQYRILDRKYWH